MLKNNKYKIMTPSGFQNFAGIRKVNKDKYYKITLNNNTTINCSIEHPFIRNGKTLRANELLKNDYIDSKNNERLYISNIELINDNIELFDIMEVSNGNIFCVNDIISHNCSFLSSGRSVIHYKTIAEYKGSCKDPIEKRYTEKLWIWKLPEDGHNYVVSADVARGDGGDFSAFHILDATNMEQVGEFKDKVATNYYANILYSIASEYNDALLIVENASQGWAVLDHLINKKYKNLYYSIKGELVLSLNLAELMNRNLDNKYESVPGWTTSHKTRGVILENMKKIITKKELIINSIRTIDELDTFIWTNSGKQEAEIGYNDDLVISLAIGLWVREIALKLKIDGNNLTRSMLNGFKTSLNSGIYTRNTVDNVYTRNIKGQQIDLREWLK